MDFRLPFFHAAERAKFVAKIVGANVCDIIPALIEYKMRKFEFPNILPRLCAGFSLLLLAMASAHAGPITWHLNSVMFNDGGSESGYFVYDMATQAFADWDVTSQAGGLTSGFLYGPNTSVALANTGTCAIDFVADGNASQFLCLNPESALIAGATPALSSSSFESYPGGVRMVVSGGVIDDPPPGAGDSVPEPASFCLVLIGATTLFAGFSRIRRRPV